MDGWQALKINGCGGLGGTSLRYEGRGEGDYCRALLLEVNGVESGFRLLDSTFSDHLDGSSGDSTLTVVGGAAFSG